MIDIGYLPSIVKSVTKFFSLWGTSNARTLNSIQDLMATISFKSLSSNGNISVSFCCSKKKKKESKLKIFATLRFD